jgi:hypothetical protein
VLDNVDGALADATAAYGALRTAVEAVPIRALDTAAQQISYMISDQLSTIDTSLARAQTAFNYLVDQVSQQTNVSNSIFFTAEPQTQSLVSSMTSMPGMQVGTECPFQDLGPYPTQDAAERKLTDLRNSCPPDMVFEGHVSPRTIQRQDGGFETFYYVSYRCCSKSTDGGQQGTQVYDCNVPSDHLAKIDAEISRLSTTGQPIIGPAYVNVGDGCSYQLSGPWQNIEGARNIININFTNCPADTFKQGCIIAKNFRFSDGSVRPLYYAAYRCCFATPVSGTGTGGGTTGTTTTTTTTTGGQQCTVSCPPPVINVTCPGATGTSGTSTSSEQPTGDGTKCALPGLQVGCLVVHYEQGSDEKALRAKADAVITTLRIQNPSANYNYTIAQCGNTYALIICKQTKLDSEGCPELYQEGLKYTPKPEYSVTSLPDANDETCWQIAPLGADMWRLLVVAKQRIKSEGWYFDPSWPRE